MAKKQVTPEDVRYLAVWAVNKYSRLAKRTCRLANVDLDDVIQDVCLQYWTRVHGKTAKNVALGTIVTKLTYWRLLGLNKQIDPTKAKIKSNLLGQATFHKPDRKASRPYEVIEAHDFWSSLSQFIPDRDREIVMTVLGYEYTKVECSQQHDISPERVRQVCARWTSILRTDRRVMDEIKGV